MQYYRTADSGGHRLIVRREDEAYDLTSVHGDLRAITDLLSAARYAERPLDDIADSLLPRAERITADSLSTEAVLPVDPDEVWAAGVTYRISEEAREEESTLPAVYQDVYSADRPELFFKADGNRTVGPGEPIGVRKDSDWNVPEPELGIVLFEGEPVGYTIGNDVSSREIEGANPLYLPQAKVYDRCCALGPCFVSNDAVRDPHDLQMSMEIHREGAIIWEDETSTAEMVRTCEELVSFYRRSNALPRLAVLLTGTSLVPSGETTLRPNDLVRIEMESIGTLENPVVEV